MHTILLVFFGAGLGGVLRYWLTYVTYWLLGNRFPYGTLLVNATGCFFIGILFVVILERLNPAGQELRAFLMIGFLGGYTTFSAFSIDTLTLYESGDWLAASLNIVISVLLCISLTCLGLRWGRLL